MTATIAPARITDPAAFGRVAVLMGGTSSERDVSEAFEVITEIASSGKGCW